MEEYEYSIRAKDVKPFIKYCEDNGYILVNKTKQNRIVYENKHNRKILARITTSENNGKVISIFDCKNVNKKDESLNISRESEEMVVTSENETIIKSMLEVMDFEKVADNLRIRYEYKKDGVKFEIDDYIRPEMKVVAIEGERTKVDAIYKKIIADEKIKDDIEAIY